MSPNKLLITVSYLYLRHRVYPDLRVLQSRLELHKTLTVYWLSSRTYQKGIERFDWLKGFHSFQPSMYGVTLDGFKIGLRGGGNVGGIVVPNKYGQEKLYLSYTYLLSAWSMTTSNSSDLPVSGVSPPVQVLMIAWASPSTGALLGQYLE